MARTKISMKPAPSKPTTKKAVRPKADPVEQGTIPPPKKKATKADELIDATTNAGPAGWSKAGDVIDEVVAVRTIFPSFNYGSRIGGLPSRRIITVHGPTHGGKSALVLGLLKSFIDAGYFAGYIDAEHATPKKFADSLMGGDINNMPRLFAMRPSSYEETIAAVDKFLAWVAEKREATPDLCSIVVVDSINKLTPSRELEQLKKLGGEAIDKGWGRVRAQFNQAWLDHLVPLLAKANCSMVFIAQERDDPDDDFGDKPKIKGGDALTFDASMCIRVSKAFPLYATKEKGAAVYGYKHRVRIWKSKVGHMDGKWTDCYFHISNGTFTPEGFDIARDALNVGVELGVVRQNQSWYLWANHRWQGEHKAAAMLSQSPDVLASLLHDIAAASDIANLPENIGTRGANAPPKPEKTDAAKAPYKGRRR